MLLYTGRPAAEQPCCSRRSASCLLPTQLPFHPPPNPAFTPTAEAAAEAAADALVQQALEAGTRDNVTALLLVLDW